MRQPTRRLTQQDGEEETQRLRARCIGLIWPPLGALAAPPAAQALKSYPGHCPKSCDHRLPGPGGQRSQLTPGTWQRLCCPHHALLPG